MKTELEEDETSTNFFPTLSAEGAFACKSDEVAIDSNIVHHMAIGQKQVFAAVIIVVEDMQAPPGEQARISPRFEMSVA